MFLEHIDSLFDQVYIVDHHSIDGTTDLIKEAIKQRPSWKYYRVDVIAHLQQKVTNRLITKAFQEGADFVFVLDADEFIYIQNRASLEDILEKIEGSDCVGLLSWINCIPEDHTSTAEIDERTQLLKSPSISKFHKVIIPRSCFIKDNGIYNSTGSHSSYWSNGKKIPGASLGNIIHIPIRSERQAIRKAIISKISLLLKYDRDELKSKNHYQYNYFLRRIANGDLKWLDYLRFVHIYEDSKFVNDDQEKINAYWADAHHISIYQLGVSTNNKLGLLSQPRFVEFSKLIADALNTGFRVYFYATDVRIDGDQIIVVQNEMAESDFDWEVQRDHLLLQIKKLNMNYFSVNEEVNILRHELDLQKSKVDYYANSKSWKITKPLRQLTAIFSGKKYLDSNNKN
ncbi:glycosyltransferase family 2 protein [bacterium]|nr:glycosyltransferase family 2 protein [bacterium]